MKKILLSLIASSALSIFAMAQESPRSPVPVPPMPSSLLPGRQAPKVEDIWVVFKTHCDIGYTESVESILRKYREPMMDNALRLIEADRAKPKAERFVWNIAGWPMTGDILGPLQTPERRVKIEQALREGSIAVHALPATLETDSFDLEDYVRGLGFSSKIARDYGHPLPIACKMTDVPAHGWILPTLLNHAGVKFLQLGANYSNRPMLVPGLFWWEGPDGSRILCNYTANYGSEATPPKDWPAKNYLAVIMTHDNEGPPSPDEVARVRAAVAKMPGVRLHFGSLDDFAKAVLAEKPELPIVRGDMMDPWIHGIASMPIETKTAHNIRPLEPALETMDTQLRGWGLPTSNLAPELAKAYEQSMLYGEHTWGASSPWWGFWDAGLPNHGFLYGEAFKDARIKGLYKKFEGSFDDHRNYIRNTENIVNRELGRRLDILAQSVKMEGPRLVVWNALPWPRSDRVEIPGKPGQFLYAENVPANGYRSCNLAKAERQTPFTLTNDTLETPFFKIAIDRKRGGISSLVEKSTGRELVDQTSPYALGQYLHEQFSFEQTKAYYHAFATMNNTYNAFVPTSMPSDTKHSETTPTEWKLTACQSDNADILTLTADNTAGIARGVSIVFTFDRRQSILEVNWQITDKEANPLPEGGWQCFPFAVAEPRYLLGRLGGQADLAKDVLLGGNRHLYAINSGLTISSPAGTGVGMCAIDAPCVSIGEPGLWKYTFDYVPKQPTVFVHLYNNMWRTNFPHWVDGSWNSRVRLWPTTDLVAPSWEARVPLLAAVADGPAGKLPVTQSGLSVSRPGVLVTAFGADTDRNPGTLLRVWEQTGVSGDLTVTLPSGFKATTAQSVNLRGEKIGELIPITSSRFSFELKAYAPASLILK